MNENMYVITIYTQNGDGWMDEKKKKFLIYTGTHIYS
jgi:hypothetical protein